MSADRGRSVAPASASPPNFIGRRRVCENFLDRRSVSHIRQPRKPARIAGAISAPTIGDARDAHCRNSVWNCGVGGRLADHRGYHLTRKCRNFGPDGNIARGTGLHDAAGVDAGGRVCGLARLSRTKAGRRRSMPIKASATACETLDSPRFGSGVVGLARATAFGPACPQAQWGYMQSEDCLFLTCGRRPDPASKRCRCWCSSMAALSSKAPGRCRSMTERGWRRWQSIVVTLNYRLGAIGFLAGGSGANRLAGNYGIRDQQLALQWVQRNIAKFGGDPARVTIFGESAGAMSVGAHLVAPGSRPLFNNAIMESNPYGLPFKTPAQAGTASAWSSTRRRPQKPVTASSPASASCRPPDRRGPGRSQTSAQSCCKAGSAKSSRWSPHIDRTVDRRPAERARDHQAGHRRDQPR